MHGAHLRRTWWPFEGVQPYAGTRALPALVPRQREMHRHRNHVGEVVQLQGALVGDDGARLAQGDPGRDDVLMRAGGEVPQPVQAPAYPLVSPPGRA